MDVDLSDEEFVLPDDDLSFALTLPSAATKAFATRADAQVSDKGGVLFLRTLMLAPVRGVLASGLRSSAL